MCLLEKHKSPTSNFDFYVTAVVLDPENEKVKIDPPVSDLCVCGHSYDSHDPNGNMNCRVCTNESIRTGRRAVNFCTGFEQKEIQREVENVRAAIVAVKSSTVTTVANTKATTSLALTELETRKLSLISVANSLSVTNQISFEWAASVRRDVRKVTDLFEALSKDEIQEAHQLHKRALARLADRVKPLKEAEATLKREQDAYQNRLRQEKEKERLRLERLMQEERERVLTLELEQAAAQDDGGKVEEVFERMAAPLPAIPLVQVAVKADGASTRTLPKFNLLDPSKISHTFLLSAIQYDIGRSASGECEWLMKAIQREVVRSGKGAEEVVGEGAIEYYETASTGVRR